MKKDRTEEIARGIAESRGHSGLVDALESLSPSELSSVAMHALRRTARERDLPELATQVEKTPALGPSSADPRALNEIDRQVYLAASAFEAIDLSPLIALGSAAATGIDPNNVLAAVRNAEVAADPTIAQALECARRRKKDRKTTIRLASSQRVVRLQPINVPGFTPHFRIFTLVSAGRDLGDERFERAELLAHLDAWLTALERLARSGYAIRSMAVHLSDTRIVRSLLEARGVSNIENVRSLGDVGATLPKGVIDPSAVDEPALAPYLPRLEKIRDEVFAPLHARHPKASFSFDFSRIQALNYYCGPTFKLAVDGVEFGDGGFTDWTQRLLADKKERMFASAIGVERVAKICRPSTHELRVEVKNSGIWKLSSVLLSKNRTVLAIDPGYFPRELDDLALRAQELGRVDAVAFTHGHWDHVIGWRTFPGARVVGSPSLAEAVATKSERAAKDLAGARDFDGRWYVDRGGALEWPQVEAWGERRDIGGTIIEGLHLPGHSPDGLGLLIPEKAILIAGDYLSPEEIPFVDDLHAYRETLKRLIDLLASIDLVIPGHGPQLDRKTALAIARADLDYLDRIASAPDREAALQISLPRAADVPGMREHHVENVDSFSRGPR